MNDAPALPPSLGSLATVQPGALLGILLLITLVCWLIFTCINFYHWFRYSRHSLVLIPALVLYLFVSMFLLFYAGVGTIL